MITQIAALKLAIKALETKRRQYSFGYNAYKSGIKPITIMDANMEGVLFWSFKTDHDHYIEHNEAIQQLSDLIEILEDEPVKVEKQGRLFE